MTKENRAAVWSELEQLFLELKNMMPEIFSSSEWEEVFSLVRANEFGLALDTFIDICKEEKKEVPKSARDLLVQIAARMEISPSHVLNKLP